MSKYITFHNHSTKSLLDSCLKVKDLVAWAKANKMSHVGVTDHGEMSSLLELYKECQKQEVTPILGEEFYVTENKVDSEGKRVRDNWHLIVLCKNRQGWDNMTKLHNISYREERYYYDPRITLEELFKYKDGLIITSACIGGVLGRNWLTGDLDKAKNIAQRLKQEFGEDFYLELQNHNDEDPVECKKQHDYNKFLIKLSKELDVKCVVQNDSHYYLKEHWEAHQVLLCKNTNSKMSNPKFKFGSKEYYLKNEQEMLETFNSYPLNLVEECFDNTSEIASKIESFCITNDKYDCPVFGEPQESYDKLIKSIYNGLHRKFTDEFLEAHPEYEERLKYEISVVKKVNFVDYFLMLEDLYKFTSENGIYMGIGRGCLTSDTKVVTDKGLKLLPDVEIGDKVITNDGTWKGVYDKHVYDCDEELLEIKTYSSSKYTPKMTKDHKVLRVKAPFKSLTVPCKGGNYIKGSYTLDKSKYLNSSSLEWCKAEELTTDDYMVRPIIRRYNSNMIRIDLAKYADKKCIVTEDTIIENYGGNQNMEARTQVLPRYINIDEDFMYILGFYIGDGWIHGDRVVFACNSVTDLEVIDKIKEYFKFAHVNPIKNDSKAVYQVYVSSRIMSALFRDIVPKYTENKLIPEFALGQSDTLLRSLLDGLIQSDGSTCCNRICYDSINLQLVYQVRYLAELLGYTSNIVTRKASGSNRESYKVEFRYYKNLTSFNDGKYVYTKVKSIKPYINEENKVYDISVLGNHNYLTIDHIVHNSAGGSLALYCLDVIQLDPIKYNLLFERFINVDRVSMCDVDCDVNDKDRPKVIEYLKNRYGEDHVCNIGTYGELTAKASFKAVASVLEIPFEKANSLTSVMDSTMSLKDNYERIDTFRCACDNDKLVKRAYDIALVLEGTYAQRGTHACGMIISSKPLDDVCPCVTVKDTESKKRIVSTTFEMKEVDGDLKLLKLDILGLRNLGVLEEADKFIYKNHGVKIDYKNLDTEDEKTYKMLSEGHTCGVFQFESPLMQRIIKQVQPTCIEDLSCITAMARPGCLDSGLTETFIKRRRGEEPTVPFVEGTEKYMKDTLQLPIYQENIMQISRVMAGFSGSEADTLRKCIGKKDPVKLKAERSHFVEGAVKQGYDKDLADTVFDDIEKFGNYGFNKSHAVGYSLLSYATAYYKTNYPVEFLTALLNSVAGNLEKMGIYIAECLRLGITILPPDINESDKDFTINRKGEIRFGLNAVKGLGKSAITQIMSARNKGLFTSLEDFINRTSRVDKNNIQALLRIGALNGIEVMPKKWDMMAEHISEAKQSKYYTSGDSLEVSICKLVGYREARKSEKYTQLAELKRQLGGSRSALQQKEEYTKKQDRLMELYYEHTMKYYCQFKNYQPSEKITNELDLLGFNITTNPYKRWEQFKKFFVTSHGDSSIKYIELNEILENPYSYKDLYKFHTVGLLSEIKELKTRKGDRMAKLTVEYFGSKTNITVFPKQWQGNLEFKVQKGNMISIVGKLQETNKDYSDEDYEIKFFTMRQLNVLVNENFKCFVDVTKENVERINYAVKCFSNVERDQFLPIEKMVIYRNIKGTYVLSGLCWINNSVKLAEKLT